MAISQSTNPSEHGIPTAGAANRLHAYRANASQPIEFQMIIAGLHNHDAGLARYG
jgi:hypothetical protein